MGNAWDKLSDLFSRTVHDGQLDIEGGEQQGTVTRAQKGRLGRTPVASSAVKPSRILQGPLEGSSGCEPEYLERWERAELPFGDDSTPVENSDASGSDADL